LPSLCRRRQGFDVPERQAADYFGECDPSLEALGDIFGELSLELSGIPNRSRRRRRSSSSCASCWWSDSQFSP